MIKKMYETRIEAQKTINIVKNNYTAQQAVVATYRLDTKQTLKNWWQLILSNNMAFLLTKTVANGLTNSILIRSKCHWQLCYVHGCNQHWPTDWGDPNVGPRDAINFWNNVFSFHLYQNLSKEQIFLYLKLTKKNAGFLVKLAPLVHISTPQATKNMRQP